MRALQTLLYLYSHRHADDGEDDALLPLSFSRNQSLSYQGWQIESKIPATALLLMKDAAGTPLLLRKGLKPGERITRSLHV